MRLTWRIVSTVFTLAVVLTMAVFFSAIIYFGARAVISEVTQSGYSESQRYEDR